MEMLILAYFCNVLDFWECRVFATHTEFTIAKSWNFDVCFSSYVYAMHCEVGLNFTVAVLNHFASCYICNELLSIMHEL